MDLDSFRAASEAAEAWLACIDFVTFLGCRPPDQRGGFDLDALVRGLRDSHRKHSPSLAEASRTLASLSDGPVKWGRLPRYFSSAHEAATAITKQVVGWLVLSGAKPPMLEEARASWWKALAIPYDDLARLRERIRRERAKLLSEQEWSKAKSPADWCRELEVSLTTIKRHAEAGRLVVRKHTTKSWSIRLDSLRTYVGGK